jgi:hypothetical protein
MVSMAVTGLLCTEFWKTKDVERLVTQWKRHRATRPIGWMDSSRGCLLGVPSDHQFSRRNCHFGFCNATLRRRRVVSGQSWRLQCAGRNCVVMRKARRRHSGAATRQRLAADECHFEMKLYVGRESWAAGCLGSRMGNSWRALRWDREGAPASARVGWLQTSGM